MASEPEKRGIESVSGGANETQNVKRKRFNDIRFRILFHQDSVGRVIGRNGENLKSAREDISSKAHLRVPEFPASVRNKDRILMVSCELTDVPRLLNKLSPTIWHALEGATQREFNLLIPSDIAGAVLGKGGSTLKELRERYGCKVKMHKDKLPYSDERVLEIPGREDQIDAMIDTVVAALAILQEKPLLHDYIRYTPWVCRDDDYLGLQCGGYMRDFLGKGGDNGKLALTVRPDGQLTGHRLEADRAVPMYNYSSASNLMTGNVSMPTDNMGYNQGSGFDSSGYSNQFVPPQETYSNIRDQVFGDVGQWNVDGTYTYASLPPAPHVEQASTYHNTAIPQPDSYRRTARSPPRLPSPPRSHSSPHGRSPARGRSPPRGRSPARDYDRGRDYQTRDRSPPPPMIVDDFMNEEITKEIKVDDALTSSVIGPRGARISAVRKKTSAIIKIADDSTVVDNTRSISITGPMKEVMWAFNAVKNLILDAGEDEARKSSGPMREPQSRSPTQGSNKLFELAQTYIAFTASLDRSDEKMTKELKIPNKNAGQVLGRKASIINEIRSFSNCKILIAKDSDVVGEVRTVQIMGTPRDVHLADYLITAVQQMPRDTPQMLGLI